MDTTTSPQPALPQPPVRRRDQQKEQTRLDLSLAAFELAKEHRGGDWCLAPDL
jgi:hypothetical protein